MFESYYEEQSLRNVVFMHQRELRKIEKGVSATRFFSFERLRILAVNDNGGYGLLLLVSSNKHRGGRKYVLTEKAKILLREIEEEETEE